MTISVLLADDQALVRAGFRQLLENEDDIEVAGEAADGAQAVDSARRLEPDLVLMDIRMPVLDGIEATRRVVEATAAKVLILTTFGMDEYVFASLQAGASGFLLKDAPPEDLIDAVRVCASGDALLAPAVTRAVIEEFARRGPLPTEASSDLSALTPRELEVLRLLARGLSNPEISDALVISPATTKTHVARVLDKLGLRDRIQAVVYAYEAGVVRPGDAA
jgi:DNA-binding NarL/FixJ family response regulator